MSSLVSFEFLLSSFEVSLVWLSWIVSRIESDRSWLVLPSVVPSFAADHLMVRHLQVRPAVARDGSVAGVGGQPGTPSEHRPSTDEIQVPPLPPIFSFLIGRSENEWPLPLDRTKPFWLIGRVSKTTARCQWKGGNNPTTCFSILISFFSACSSMGNVHDRPSGRDHQALEASPEASPASLANTILQRLADEDLPYADADDVDYYDDDDDDSWHPTTHNVIHGFLFL